jgi:hypothetical protein
MALSGPLSPKLMRILSRVAPAVGLALPVSAWRFWAFTALLSPPGQVRPAICRARTIR